MFNYPITLNRVQSYEEITNFELRITNNFSYILYI